MSYPIFLDLTGRFAVVVGGGRIALRKVKGLLDAGAIVTVISPELSAGLVSLVEEDRLKWKKKHFEAEDIEGAFLIIAATDSREVNFHVKQSVGKHQLVNIADDSVESDFHTPAIMKRGKLVIAVSTSGASPILAKNIRTSLEQIYDEQYESSLNFLYHCRKKILAEVQDPIRKHQLLKALAEETFFNDSNREENFRKLMNIDTNCKNLKGGVTGLKNLNEWFNQGMTTNEYIAGMKVNKETMLGIYNSSELEVEQKDYLQGLQNRGLRALVLTADWCGDAMVNLPLFIRIANEALIDTRYFIRDENLELMDQYLTNGKSRSIPIIILIDKDGNEVTRWGPRAPEVQQLANDLFGSLPAKDSPEYEAAFKKAIPDFQSKLSQDKELWAAISKDLIMIMKRQFA